LATSVVAFLGNATRFGTIVLIPIDLTKLNNLAPIWIGAVLFPGAMFVALMSPWAGRLADKKGPRLPVTWGCGFIVAGNVLTAFFPGGAPWGSALGMALYGVGFAMLQSPLIAAATKIVPRSQTGVGIGIFMMIFFLGGATGVALSVTTLELQSVGAASWLGLDLGGGGPFSNALLVLTILAFIGLALVPLVPGAELVEDRD